MPREKRAKAVNLFFFWKDINPVSLIQSNDSRNILNNLKNSIFQLASGEISEIRENTLGIEDLLSRLSPPARACCLKLLLNLIKSSEALTQKFYLYRFSDLEYILSIAGESIALFSLNVLYQENFKNNEIAKTDSIKLLSTAILLLEIFKYTTQLTLSEERLFLPLEDLLSFRCTEKPFSSESEFINQNILALTNFELEKLIEMFDMSKRLMKELPSDIAKITEALADMYIEETRHLLKSEWCLNCPLPKKKVRLSSVIAGVFPSRNNV